MKSVGPWNLGRRKAVYFGIEIFRQIFLMLSYFVGYKKHHKHSVDQMPGQGKMNVWLKLIIREIITTNYATYWYCHFYDSVAFIAIDRRLIAQLFRISAWVSF